MNSDKQTRRHRIYEIIQLGSHDDFPSKVFDISLAATIFVSIIVSFMLTFEVFEKAFTFLKIVDIVTLLLFFVEYLLRIWTADYLYPGLCRGRAVLRFLFSFDGIVDLLTILPLVSLEGFVVFRLLRVIRIFHLFRINSNYDSFNIITLVLKDKWKQIGFSVIIILIFMMASSLGIYSLEHEAQPEVFSNAFSGIWWSMSTLFTIGYGDIYPVTVAGRLMTLLISFLGVGLVAIPTGIISAGFVEQYTYRANAERKLTDISEIGEILIDGSNGFLDKTIAEITADKTLKALLVIRGDLQLIPSDALKLEKDDILVIESKRVTKEKMARKKGKSSK